ncbi:class I SAM-dependent methyltransferase [Tautonia rosea]|uniref:class I SAM-dependent methyltransferase n=1 Tax=Tautonia rosea TaxID=2728037 RepID=UPI0014756557|nr:class I SAM-dependent methyltransferase [Tautonia rosea]
MTTDSAQPTDSADEFDAWMSALQGGITPEEGALLRRLASQVRTGCIVEVGSYRGKSAVALASGVHARPEPERPAIYCVEPHRPFVGFYGGAFGPEDRGAYYEAMCRTGAFRNVALIGLSSEQITPGWTDPVGLLFLDGDHRYEGVRRDFECWEPHVAPGGLVVFDDATDPNCGPHRLIAELLETGRYRHRETIGKVVVLESLGTGSSRAQPAQDSRPRRLLIACHELIATGGLLRFDRVGRVLRDWGHEVAFVGLAEAPTAPMTDAFHLPMLTPDEAASRHWDAVMVPGAGFPETTIAQLHRFRDDRYGVRVQHILNDSTRRQAFLAVNAALAPHVVLFNNRHWPVGTFTEFSADRFQVLLGAVDLSTFRPRSYRSHPQTRGRWVIGGQAGKNPGPLIEALALLPSEVVLRLFGSDGLNLAQSHAELIASGRLELTGMRIGDDLARFYAEVDCVAMTETFAGWSNLVAEAMASGVPVVCTGHGTLDLARHEETALVVDDPTPDALAAAIARLKDDAILCRNLTEQALETIRPYSWEAYARKLLELTRHDFRHHYLHDPASGLYGKWPLDDRLRGLMPLIERSAGLSVIDFGAAEGFVARELLRRGASQVLGFELDPGRVAAANELCAPFGPSRFRVADLSDWHRFRSTHADVIEDGYDIVLYLGLQHHLPCGDRLETLDGAAALARRYFAIRTTPSIYEQDAIDARLRASGFEPIASTEDAATNGRSYLGAARIFERRCA